MIQFAIHNINYIFNKTIQQRQTATQYLGEQIHASILIPKKAAQLALSRQYGWYCTIMLLLFWKWRS